MEPQGSSLLRGLLSAPPGVLGPVSLLRMFLLHPSSLPPLCNRSLDISLSHSTSTPHSQASGGRIAAHSHDKASACAHVLGASPTLLPALTPTGRAIKSGHVCHILQNLFFQADNHAGTHWLVRAAAPQPYRQPHHAPRLTSHAASTWRLSRMTCDCAAHSSSLPVRAPPLPAPLREAMLMPARLSERMCRSS